MGLLVAAFVAWGLDAARSPTSCPSSSGDSNYGQAGWSWVPPGPTCTFTTEANGFEATDGPGRGSPLVIVALAVTGVIAVGVLWAAVRRLRADPRALDDDPVA